MSSNLSQEDEEHKLEKEEIYNYGGENAELNSPETQLKRKRNRRHTSEQIHAMEDFFKECPHPDNRQRTELSRELGMDPLQVKFWFQNKRTQTKTKYEHRQNKRLRAENERLRAENTRYKEALSNSWCVSCGGMAAIGAVTREECHLRMENARLRNEIERISTVAANYVGKPLINSRNTTPSSPVRATSLATGLSFRGSTSKGNESVGEEASDEPKTTP
ncbi:homeobox-leucine zipper family protein [Striga asiatica]|uniref:Homeobox-leucine zipper family protein n=1 Tax=Striga asiatica TaxID=4170 RepID=A0A5A7QGY0_STRAF|nr:homeobox-leucine zipper family protein [Striga asiatica]